MMNDSTSGLGSDKLAQLLQLGADEQNVGDPENSNAQKATMLATLLTHSLPVNAVLIQSLPAIIQRVCQELESLPENSMDKILLDPSSDVAVIDQIKSYAKQKTKSAPSNIEREAAIALYYAAIASALIFHNKQITKKNHTKLRKSFEQLSVLQWVDKRIANLLSDAAALCAKRVTSDVPRKQ